MIPIGWMKTFVSFIFFCFRGKAKSKSFGWHKDFQESSNLICITDSNLLLPHEFSTNFDEKRNRRKTKTHFEIQSITAYFPPSSSYSDKNQRKVTSIAGILQHIGYVAFAKRLKYPQDHSYTVQLDNSTSTHSLQIIGKIRNEFSAGNITEWYRTEKRRNGKEAGKVNEHRM